jgi:hypothetical protein
MSEELDILKGLEPSWKSIPAPPTRLPIESGSESLDTQLSLGNDRSLQDMPAIPLDPLDDDEYDDDVDDYIGTVLTPRSIEIGGQKEVEAPEGEEEAAPKKVGTIDVIFNMAKFVYVDWFFTGESADISIDGVVLTGDPKQVFNLPFPCTLTVIVNTDNQGGMRSNPVEIVSDEEVPNSIHHVPPSAEGVAVAGIYTWVVAKFIDDKDDGPVWVPENTSLYWNDYTRSNVNKGAGARVSIKTTVDAEDWWRSFVGDEVDDYTTGDSPKIHTTVVEKQPVDGNGDVIEGETSVEIETTSEPRGATGTFQLLESCGSASTTDALEFENGMLKTIIGGPYQLGECNSGGGGTLPSGTVGQMLYHNGTTWVVLAAPSAPLSTQINIMTHSGTAPLWETKTIGTHSVCVSGTPTATDFIEL